MNDFDEDIRTLPPPAKRQRRTSDRRMSKALPEQQEFWFHDGDIVIVFADMLELPQPSHIESLQGCPLVNLSQDSAKDWLVVLKWLYQREKFDNQTVVFDSIAGALRISNKYDIADLRQWSIRQLLLCWPRDLTKMTYTAFPHAAEAICLARECDVPEILPAAFYALSIVRWSRRADGGQSHLQLSPADLRCFIVGREELQDHLHSILSGEASGNIVLCTTCENVSLAWLSSRLKVDASSPYGTWLLRDLQDFAVNDCPGLSFTHHLCDLAFRWRINQFIHRLQEAIPRYFMLRS